MPPTYEDIEHAARRLAGHAVRTPVIESPRLNSIVGGRVLIKAECLQRTGSFKFRGAWNRISQLDPQSAPGGVVAYSSGNHAQGVAAAAQLRGLPALIVMPADTPRIKQENTKAFGAEVVTYDRARESREEIAAHHVRERGAVLVPPFDDPYIIAGQGTAGLELADEAEQRGVSLDHVLVCCSGGRSGSTARSGTAAIRAFGAGSKMSSSLRKYFMWRGASSGAAADGLRGACAPPSSAAASRVISASWLAATAFSSRLIPVTSPWVSALRSLSAYCSRNQRPRGVSITASRIASKSSGRMSFDGIWTPLTLPATAGPLQRSQGTSPLHNHGEW